MNKVIFHEGGQPIFLDDLKTIQDFAMGQLSNLLRVLGQEEDIFLLNDMSGDIVSYDSETGKTTFKIKKNWIVNKGLIFEIPETTVSVLTWEDPLYVGFKSAEIDKRTFEDGQEHACMINHEAFLSTTKTGTSMMNVFDLKTLWNLIAPKINSSIPVQEYKDISVDFRNGYSGKVQYKDVGDAYRVKISVSSDNFAWETYSGSSNPMKMLFTFKDNSFPYANRTFYADVVIGVGGDTEARAQHATLQNREMSVWLDVNSNLDYPSACPVKTIFEIPK